MSGRGLYGGDLLSAGDCERCLGDGLGDNFGDEVMLTVGVLPPLPPPPNMNLSRGIG